MFTLIFLYSAKQLECTEKRALGFAFKKRVLDWVTFLSSSLKRSWIKSSFLNVTKWEGKAESPTGAALAESLAKKGSQSKSATACCNDCAKTEINALKDLFYASSFSHRSLIVLTSY